MQGGLQGSDLHHRAQIYPRKKRKKNKPYADFGHFGLLYRNPIYLSQHLYQYSFLWSFPSAFEKAWKNLGYDAPVQDIAGLGHVTLHRAASSIILRSGRRSDIYLHATSRNYVFFFILFIFSVSAAMFYLGLILLGCSQLALTKTVTYDWSIDWVNRNPDGAFPRPVIGINGEWPCPQIDVDLGDHLVVNIYNNLGNESTGLHWHGLNQYGHATMDGSAGAAQCPVPPNSSFTYSFPVS